MLRYPAPFLFVGGPDGGEVDGCLGKVKRWEGAFPEQRGGDEAAIAELEHFESLRFRREHPNFGDAEGFVVAEFLSAFRASISRRHDFDRQAWRGVNVAV